MKPHILQLRLLSECKVRYYAHFRAPQHHFVDPSCCTSSPGRQHASHPHKRARSVIHLLLVHEIGHEDDFVPHRECPHIPTVHAPHTLASQTVFGTVAAPSTVKYRRLPHTFGWVWMHLLQFCISNQSLSEGEDLANKAWRPLPAKRISLATMLRIRWTLLPACLVYSSLYHGARWPSLALSAGIFMHNEMYLDSHWATRNLCNALGYAAFNAGATYVACGTSPIFLKTSKRMMILYAEECSLSNRTLLAQLISSLIVLTTIHSQDFEDVEGDRIQGRRTLPLVFPQASRTIMVILLPAWSLFLSFYWRSGSLYCATLLGLGIALAARYLFLRSQKSDRMSYILYNVRMSTRSSRILLKYPYRSGYRWPKSRLLPRAQCNPTCNIANAWSSASNLHQNIVRSVHPIYCAEAVASGAPYPVYISWAIERPTFNVQRPTPHIFTECIKSRKLRICHCQYRTDVRSLLPAVRFGISGALRSLLTGTHASAKGR